MSADTCTAKSRLALLNWFDWPSECSVHLSKQNKELAKLCAALDAIRPGQVAFHLSIRGNCQLAVLSLALIGKRQRIGVQCVVPNQSNCSRCSAASSHSHTRALETNQNCGQRAPSGSKCLWKTPHRSKLRHNYGRGQAMAWQCGQFSKTAPRQADNRLAASFARATSLLLAVIMSLAH